MAEHVEAAAKRAASIVQKLTGPENQLPKGSEAMPVTGEGAVGGDHSAGHHNCQVWQPYIAHVRLGVPASNKQPPLCAEIEACKGLAFTFVKKVGLLTGHNTEGSISMQSSCSSSPRCSAACRCTARGRTARHLCVRTHMHTAVPSSAVPS